MGRTVFGGLADLYGDRTVAATSRQYYPLWGAGLQFVLKDHRVLQLSGMSTRDSWLTLRYPDLRLYLLVRSASYSLSDSVSDHLVRE